MNDVRKLTRLAVALRNSPAKTAESTEIPQAWRCDDMGMWTPVFADGRLGDHSFTLAQMLAVRGEDLGGVIESLVAAGLITERSPAGVEMFVTDLPETGG